MARRVARTAARPVHSDAHAVRSAETVSMREARRVRPTAHIVRMQELERAAHDVHLAATHTCGLE